MLTWCWRWMAMFLSDEVVCATTKELLVSHVHGEIHHQSVETLATCLNYTSLLYSPLTLWLYFIILVMSLHSTQAHTTTLLFCYTSTRTCTYSLNYTTLLLSSFFLFWLSIFLQTYCQIYWHANHRMSSVCSQPSSVLRHNHSNG